MLPKLFVGITAALAAALSLLIAGLWPDGHGFWYLTRATGFTAYLMLSLDMAFGLVVQTKAFEPFLARWRSYDLHEVFGLLGLGFLGVHLVALLGDHYAPFSVADLLVPFLAAYRSFWTGLGVISLYLLVLVTASFYLRRWVGHRVWRSLHFLSFPAYLLSLGHAVFAGTDTAVPWAKVLYLGTAALVAMLLAWRMTDAPRAAKRSLAPRPANTAP